MRTPYAGRAVDVNENLIPGTWVALHEKLLHVTGARDAKGEILVEEADLGRLVPLETLFRARLTDCRSGAAPLQELRGTAHLIGKSSGVAGILLRRAIVGLQAGRGR